jgi:hypothetical protein
MSESEDPLHELRILTARVVLAMFAFTVVGDFFDNLVTGNRYGIDPGIFAMVTTLIGALFASELLKHGRSK